MEQPDEVCARAHDEPTVAERLLERARPTHAVAPLEHDDRQPCASEIRRTRQAVVTAADDHRVPAATRHLGDGSQVCPLSRRSLSLPALGAARRAARAPLAASRDTRLATLAQAYPPTLGDGGRSRSRP